MKFSASVLAIAIGLAVASSVVAAPAPKTAAAAKAGSAADAQGKGSNIGDGVISATSASSATDNPKIKATGVSAASAKGHGDNGSGVSSNAGSRSKAFVNAGLDKKGVAHVAATAIIAVGAQADSAGKTAKIGAKVTVTAAAKGGAKPTASTNVRGTNGKIIVKASATAGVGAVASGGTTVIKHFGPGGKDELAITYTKNAYSAAVETPKSATAYSGYAKNGVTFKGPNLVAAIELAAFAYASASNNNAVGYAQGHGFSDSRGNDATSNADTSAYASAFVNGDTVLIGVAGSPALLKGKVNQVCTYHIAAGGGVALTCHSVGP